MKRKLFENIGGNQLKEVAVDNKHSNIKGQRELPHVNGPATPQVKETSNDKSGAKSFYDSKPGETGQYHLDRIKKEKERNLQ
jgi:hypothetical protein